jgi:hypothetical protein
VVRGFVLGLVLVACATASKPAAVEPVDEDVLPAASSDEPLCKDAGNCRAEIPLSGGVKCIIDQKPMPNGTCELTARRDPESLLAEAAGPTIFDVPCGESAVACERPVLCICEAQAAAQ